MKLIFTSTIFVLLFSVANAQQNKTVAQQKKIIEVIQPPKPIRTTPLMRAIKINATGFILSPQYISFEKGIGKNFSVVVSPCYEKYNHNGFTFNGFNAELGARYYFKKQIKRSTLNGLYAMPAVYYALGSYNIKSKESTYKYSTIGGRLSVGYQLMLRKGFLLDFFAGAIFGSYNYKQKPTNATTTLSSTGVLPSAGIAIGYKF